jgi:hypothetical protein
MGVKGQTSTGLNDELCDTPSTYWKYSTLACIYSSFEKRVIAKNARHK